MPITEYMDREGFLETMRRQYIEDIHEAYQASLHEGGGRVDYVHLSGVLSQVMRRASKDGFKPMDFEELVYATLPLYRSASIEHAASSSDSDEKGGLTDHPRFITRNERRSQVFQPGSFFISKLQTDINRGNHRDRRGHHEGHVRRRRHHRSRLHEGHGFHEAPLGELR